MSGRTRIAIWSIAVAISIAGYMMQHFGYLEPGSSSLITMVAVTVSGIIVIQDILRNDKVACSASDNTNR